MIITIYLTCALIVCLAMYSWKKTGDRIRYTVELYGKNPINSILRRWQLLDSVRYSACISDDTPSLYRLTFFDIEHYNIDINIPNPGVVANKSVSRDTLYTTLYITIRKNYHIKKYSIYSIGFSHTGYEVDPLECQETFDSLDDLLNHIKLNFIDTLRKYHHEVALSIAA